jgi:hypothetical protein
MLKELVARVFLVLFIIGVVTEAAPDDGNSATANQQPSDPGAN